MRVSQVCMSLVAAVGLLPAQILPMGSTPTGAVTGPFWTELHHTTATNLSCMTTCSLTISSTTANSGQLLVSAFQGGTTNEYITTVTGAGTWTCPAGSRLSQSGTGAVSACYNLASTAGVTSLSLTAQVSGSNYRVVQYEFSWSGSTIIFDLTSTVHTVTCGTTCSGVNLALTGTRDAAAQYIVLNTSSAGPSAITAPYGNLDNSQTFTGFSDATNVYSGNVQPNWTLPATNDAVKGAIALRGT